ncbi:MAG: hypothetical protein G01um101429_16 [Parcubacteria group bacterium Gr01-1014_29]|nr:MAG: hypothetical protein G01um101429_16 [Parcubacteria group bacterium Gr01-1014_29]
MDDVSQLEREFSESVDTVYQLFYELKHAKPLHLSKGELQELLRKNFPDVLRQLQHLTLLNDARSQTDSFEAFNFFPDRHPIPCC